ncbi:hypothetical protein GE21DRAFT_1250607 [Neurospora crassa]|nr:hypothetical protein GE21DRAFT_1250607 [Neurospora crassa]
MSQPLPGYRPGAHNVLAIFHNPRLLTRRRCGCSHNLPYPYMLLDIDRPISATRVSYPFIFLISRLGRARPQDSIYLYQRTARFSLAVMCLMGLGSVSCPSCVLHVLSLFSCPVLSRFSGGSLDRPRFKLEGEEEMREKRNTH